MNYSAVARRITLTLFLTQSLGSAGFIAAATISTIVGALLTGNIALAGVPSFVYQGGVAVSAYFWGRTFDRIGRRNSMTIGMGFSVLGSGLAAFAIYAHSFFIFAIGLLFMGAGRSAIDLGRFIAAEVHPPAQRARAISNVVIGGTVGSVFGPLMVGIAGAWALQTGFNELTGPYVFSLVLFALSSLIVFAGLRPEPREVGKEIARQYAGTTKPDTRARPLAEILRDPNVVLAMTVMVFGQTIMVMLMAITALYMKEHQHALTDISLVISSHTFGMFAFSIISGRLADRWGRRPVIFFGALMLTLSCIAATLSPDVLPLSFALFLLGLGWNFCYVGGSSLLADQLSPAERARTQGFNDLLIGGASAFGGLGSGFVFATVGYNSMSIIAGITSLIPMVMLVRSWNGARKLAVVD